MPMYGEATGIDEEKGYVNIRLRNMCGVLKLTLKGSATINSILVEDRSGAPVSGYATLGMQEIKSSYRARRVRPAPTTW